MPHRDPQTGEFVSQEHYDDIEVVTWGVSVGVEASNLGGSTGFGGEAPQEFEGAQVIDYDEIVDRNEMLRLVEAQHVISVYVNSTETADGIVAASVEMSADPSLSPATQEITTPGTAQSVGDDDVVTAGNAPETDDSIDLIGRPLTAVGTGPFSDSGTGVGGGGAAGHDEYVSTVWPAEFGVFHPRDECFVNGRIQAWNIDDAGVHVDISGQHVYGVLED
jgi:hypothetical protein